MIKFLYKFEKLNKIQKITINLFPLIIITLLDFLTGNEISFSIFYLIPIALITRAVNRNFGLIFSVISSFLWLSVFLVYGNIYSPGLIHFWNSLGKCIDTEPYQAEMSPDFRP